MAWRKLESLEVSSKGEMDLSVAPQTRCTAGWEAGHGVRKQHGDLCRDARVSVLSGLWIWIMAKTERLGGWLVAG